MRYVYKIVFFVLLISGLAACKKEAGEGGQAIINARVLTKYKAIKNAGVFVKYGEDQSPGKDTTLYNKRVVTDENGKARLPGMRKGTYYFYSTFVDSSSKKRFDGGKSITIEEKYGEFDVVIMCDTLK